MIKNIIFDLGNVVVKCPDVDLVKEFFKDEKEAEIFGNYIYKSEYWKMLDLGKMEDEDIAEEKIEKKLVEVSNPDEIMDFMRNWYKKRNLHEEVLALGKTLKEKGYKIYILSNMAKSTYTNFKSRYNFFNMVDGAVVSGFEGMKKPEKAFFEILLNRYNLNPEECLMIDDDDTNRTLEMANSLGIHGRRVIPNNVEDIKKLLEENNVEY